MSRCFTCDSSVSRKQSVLCSGSCKNIYHPGCVNIPSELVSYLSSVTGLEWKCSTCRVLDGKVDDKKLHDIFEKKCTTLFNEFSSKFEDMKIKFMQSTLDKISEINQPSLCQNTLNTEVTYAEKLRQGPVERIAVKPKNPNQKNSRTKSDLLHLVNPVDLNVKINNVKHISNGGILLDCNKSEEVSKLKEIVQEKMSSDYEIHVLKSIHPQLRIVGISENFDPSTLLMYIRKQNDIIFTSNSECSILRMWPTKKNNNIYQATLQVDMSTYNKLLSQGHLLVGLDSCTVYDAIHVPRCFKCNQYFHSKNSCKNEVSCPICSKAHNLENCPSGSKLHCSNCFSIKEKQKLDINIDHAVWDYENCFAHKKAIEKLKFDLFGTPNK